MAIVPKVSSLNSRGFVSEATIFPKEEVKKAAKVVEEAISKDNEAAKATRADVTRQFIPNQNDISVVTPDDAAKAYKSYAVSHGNGSEIETYGLG